jgi:hypothetical protein
MFTKLHNKIFCTKNQTIGQRNIMDDILYQALQNEIEMEGIDDEESALIIAAAVLVGTELTQQEHIDRWQPRQQYLCRAQLLPNPQMSTPWQALFASQND